MVRLLTLLVALPVVLGCSSVEVTKTARGYFEPTDANQVDILKTIPDRKYTELGTVTVTGFAPDATARMHNEVRTKAAPLGANAVILTEEGIIQNGLGGVTRWATGVAVRYD